MIIIEQLLKEMPTNPQWNYMYALCLHQLSKDSAKALHHYTYALENGCDEFWVRYNRGLLLSSIGEKEAAANDLERALTLAPEDKATLEVLKSIQVKK